MKIGICTTDFSRSPLEELFTKIEAMGFEAIQLSFDSVAETGFQADHHIEIPEFVSENILAQIRQSAERHHLEIAACNGTYNMAHPDESVRQEGLRRFPGFCQAVKALGCHTVSICSGTRSYDSLWTADVANEGEDAWRDMTSSMKAAATIAEEMDITLAIEPEAGNIVSSPERAIRLLQEVGSGHLKMIMDCANLFHIGEARRENARKIIGHAFDVFGPYVALAHGKDIAESDGIHFCATGDGIVDFPYFLSRLQEQQYTGVFMLHGIYDEQKMTPCRKMMADLMQGKK